MTDLIPVDTTGDRTRLACPQCRSTRIRLLTAGRWLSRDGGGRLNPHQSVRFCCDGGHIFTIVFCGVGGEVLVDCEIRAIRSIFTPDDHT